MKIDFKDGVKLKQLKISKGNRDWDFSEGGGPWEVSEQDWKTLKKFDLFEEVTSKKEPEPEREETATEEEEEIQEEEEIVTNRRNKRR